MSSIAHSSHMDIFQNLTVDMDTEGRDLFLNCIANQLRYPDSHNLILHCVKIEGGRGNLEWSGPRSMRGPPA